MRERHDETAKERGGRPADPLAFEEPHRPGVEQARRVMEEHGDAVTPAEIAQVVIKFPGEADAILSAVHGIKGNAFVVQVEKYIHELFPPTETDKLLAWVPTEEKGDEGQAAWLLRAGKLGWVEIRGETQSHLTAYVKKKKSVESTEGIPAKSKDHGIDPKRVVGDGQGVYDVPVKDAAILGILVHMVRTHAEARLADHRPTPAAAFDLGTMLRLDHGFGGSQHTVGNAIDLGGMHFDTVEDVMYALELLPEGTVSRVFPDNKNHMHLSVNGGTFELGLPFQGEFFPSNMNITERREAAIDKAGTGEKELKATGLYFGSTTVNTSKRYFNEDKQKWMWTDPSGGGRLAIEYLKSEPLKQKLTEMGAPRE